MTFRIYLLLGKEGRETFPEVGRGILSSLAQGFAVIRIHIPPTMHGFLQMREEWTVIIRCWSGRQLSKLPNRNVLELPPPKRNISGYLQINQNSRLHSEYFRWQTVGKV